MALTGCKVVFVGNIPYDTTEETMIEIFQEVGPVVNFRINKDRETGKAKGYGFCEYHDAATAASAVRNLDGYAFSGRQLRVAPADSENPPQSQQNRNPPPPVTTTTTTNVPNSNLMTSMGQHATPTATPYRPSTLNPPAHNAPKNHSGIPTTEAINATLATMSPDQIYELIAQTNLMIQYNPETARLFLSQNPQFRYALFQALFILNIVDSDIANSLIVESTNNPGNPHLPPPPTMPTSLNGETRPPGGLPNYPFSQLMSGLSLAAPLGAHSSHLPHGLPPAFPSPVVSTLPPLTFSLTQSQFTPRPVVTPPPHRVTSHPGPSSVHPTPSPPQPPPPADQQSALLRQVLQMTPEQIDQVPAAHRESLLKLRAQLLGNQKSNLPTHRV